MCSFIDFFMAQRKSSEIGKMKNKWYLKYNPLFLTYVYRRYRKLNNSLKSTRLIAISKHMQTLLQKHRLQSTVIPNALDVSSFKKEKRKSGKLRVLYLGSLTQFKGPHILLKAINGLNCHCDLYGEGNLRSRLQRIIEKDGLDATIHNNVSYEKVPSLYAQADIVVFPSIWPEPFGRIAIEGMAAGKPVIGSRIGGIAETIEEGTGILVDPGKVRDLNDALEILAHDKNLRIEMGKKGKKVVSKKYTENKVITKLIEFYNEEGI